MRHAGLCGSPYTDIVTATLVSSKLQHENSLYFVVDHGFGLSPSENSLMVGAKESKVFFSILQVLHVMDIELL